VGLSPCLHVGFQNASHKILIQNLREITQKQIQLVLLAQLRSTTLTLVASRQVSQAGSTHRLGEC
jgi:hypothetical protein